MRLVLAAAAFALILPALAQQPRQTPARPAPPARTETAPEPPAGLFPCRTAGEICTIGIVTGPNQIAVLFTNAQPTPPPAPPASPAPPARGGPAGRAAQAPAAEPDVVDKPVDVMSGDAPGTPLDLAPHLGRVVMLTGSYDPKAGLTKAELVEVASPLLSFALKTILTGDDQPGGGTSQPGSASKRR